MKTIRAFILAAGKGKRLNLLTKETPKPLVKIGSITIIESIIKFLHSNSITDIYVITGYKREKFDSELVAKYDLKLIYNPDYESTNNISSIYHARDFLDRMLIIEGDIFFDNSIQFKINTNSAYSFYLTEMVADSKEWIVTVNKFIKHTNIQGGNGNRIYGISFWTSQDAQRLRELLVYEYKTKKNTSIYWDNIVLDIYLNQFNLKVKKIPKNTIYEIDTEQEYNTLINLLERKNEINKNV
jgi:L-glutamine-phosphate cytidylyltransferase